MTVQHRTHDRTQTGETSVFIGRVALSKGKHSPFRTGPRDTATVTPETLRFAGKNGSFVRVLRVSAATGTSVGPHTKSAHGGAR